MQRIDPFTYLDLQSIVEQAAQVLNVKPPRLLVLPIRNACYRALFHQIHLSERLALCLGETDLRAILAHEVKHAAQRRQILSNAFPLLAIPSLVWLAFGIPAYWLASVTGSIGLPCAVFAVSTWLTYFAFRLVERPLRRRDLAMEIEADAFAREFTGKANAIESALRASAKYEDGCLGGDLGLRRIEEERRLTASEKGSHSISGETVLSVEERS